jgi:hypothetical protein
MKNGIDKIESVADYPIGKFEDENIFFLSEKGSPAAHTHIYAFNYFADKCVYRYTCTILPRV